MNAIPAPAVNPELGHVVDAGGIATNVHDLGREHAQAVVLIHGSGPGVSGYANWRLVMPQLATRMRVVVPDMVGFGFTERPTGLAFDLERWVAQWVGLIDSLGLQQVDLVGNSFGGAVALAAAIRHPQRVRRLVLMGAAGVPFMITPELDEVWGYEPSFERMRRMMDLFAYNRALVTDELAELRYRASIRPGFQESYAALFPAPRQRWVDGLESAEAGIRALPHETLVIHGRDDRVIPLQNALTLHQWISRSQLHVFGQCGHWTQIEHAGRFARLVTDFLTESA